VGKVGPRLPTGEVNPAEQAAFAAELEYIGQREKQLRDNAQKAKNVADELYNWGLDLAQQGNWLLTTVLSDEDAPEVHSYLRGHSRFLRTCQEWAAKLQF
jgi:histidinol-phosphate/aromatic aminotransferase/cobyric acid decarboxylase-like protein